MRNRFFSFFLLSLLLLGCANQNHDQSPVDPQAIQTEAVQTALAEMTVQAILNPSVTPSIATDTPQPNQSPGSESELSASSEDYSEIDIPPVITETPIEEIFRCEIIMDQSLPGDGAQPAGAEIDKSWVVKNTGNVFWTNDKVKMKWVGGVNLGKEDQVDLSKITKPGDTIELSVSITIPGKVTSKMQIMEWALVNPRNEIFCKLYYLISYSF